MQGACGRPTGSAESPRIPAGRAQHGDHDDPRGQVRAVRWRQPSPFRDELRRSVGRVHGRLLHIGSDAGTVRCRSSDTSKATKVCPNCKRGKEFILGAQVTAAAYARNYGGTVKEIREAQRVNGAFQRVLDTPRQRGTCAPSVEAAAQRGSGLRGAAQKLMSDHISGPRALADPIADITDVYRVPQSRPPGSPRSRAEHVAVRAGDGRFSEGSCIGSVCGRSVDRPAGRSTIRRRCRGVRVRLCLL